MKIEGIAHVGYTVRDMEKSLQFYCDGLGFQKKFLLKNREGQPWIIYLEIAPKQFLELFYNLGQMQSAPAEYLGYRHLSLEVTGIKELEADLRAKGIAVRVPPRLERDHTWQMWVDDPDGNPIEFHEYTAESYQVVGKED